MKFLPRILILAIATMAIPLSQKSQKPADPVKIQGDFEKSTYKVEGVGAIILKDATLQKSHGNAPRQLKAGTIVAFGEDGNSDYRVIKKSKGLIWVFFRVKNHDVFTEGGWVQEEVLAKFSWIAIETGDEMKKHFLARPFYYDETTNHWRWNRNFVSAAEERAKSLNLEAIEEIEK